MKNIILMLVMIVSFSATAQSSKSKNAKYTVEVNGNCEMCKSRIEKAAFSVPGVKSAVWDISDHSLSLIINEEKTSLDNVKVAVSKVGHDVEGVKASDESYAKLHGCCQYERKE